MEKRIGARLSVVGHRVAREARARCRRSVARACHSGSAPSFKGDFGVGFAERHDGRAMCSRSDNRTEPNRTEPKQNGRAARRDDAASRALCLFSFFFFFFFFFFSLCLFSSPSSTTRAPIAAAESPELGTSATSSSSYHAVKNRTLRA